MSVKCMCVLCSKRQINWPRQTPPGSHVASVDFLTIYVELRGGKKKFKKS